MKQSIRRKQTGLRISEDANLKLRAVAVDQRRTMGATVEMLVEREYAKLLKRNEDSIASRV